MRVRSGNRSSLFVSCLTVAVVPQELLRRRRRVLPADARASSFPDRSPSMIVVVHARRIDLEQARALAGLDDDLVDERLRRTWAPAPPPPPPPPRPPPPTAALEVDARAVRREHHGRAAIRCSSATRRPVADISVPTASLPPPPPPRPPPGHRRHRRRPHRGRRRSAAATAARDDVLGRHVAQVHRRRCCCRASVKNMIWPSGEKRTFVICVGFS